MRKNLWSKKPSFELRPMCAAVLLAFSVNASANPNGGTVVNGSASFNTNGNTLTVTNTPGTIINWQGFSINSNEITHFAQQSASSAVLNRVITSNPSVILGTLSSNGRVFLVNPGGIVFGAGSTVDVAGMVATSLNLSDADFLAGRGNFTLTPGAQAVSNAGNITAQSGGEIYLIAPNVENSGVITAPNGEILLAAGHEVQLVNTLDPNLRVNITAPAGDATNIGQLVSSAGRLGLFGTVVKNTGAVSADSATMQGGKIVFKASQRVELGGTVSANGTSGGSVNIAADHSADLGAPGSVIHTGSIQARGTTGAGGAVNLSGDSILSSASISTDGTTSGGQVSVQASNRAISTASAQYTANSTQGRGGDILVSAAVSNYTSGSYSATGTTGGNITLAGSEIKLAGTQADASGVLGGGTVHIGGLMHGLAGFSAQGLALSNATTVLTNGATALRADATNTGNGGEVVLWSDQLMNFKGTISARGGIAGGDGGTAEVSGMTTLVYSGLTDLSASNGLNGTLLLDPRNITIVTGNNNGLSIVPYQQILDPTPGAGEGFGGWQSIELSSGNLVIASPLDSAFGTNSGAVYFYSASGTLISTLVGSAAGDKVGGVTSGPTGFAFDQGGIKQLANGNVVVFSNNWNAQRGAVTWINGSTGALSDGSFGGAVANTNSLVGTLAGDQVGITSIPTYNFWIVRDLANSNIGILSSNWGANGVAANALGAVTWMNGANGKLSTGANGGEITASNSLVGAVAGDKIGILTNGSSGVGVYGGNLLVGSQNWSGGAGALTWMNGATGALSDGSLGGVVAATNSLVGSVGEGVGGGITPLSNNNLMIWTQGWSGNGASAGAITWMNGATGKLSDGMNGGLVSAANSLVGAAAGDLVGQGYSMEVTNGIYLNYIVHSKSWGSGGIYANSLGAVTWVNGANGLLSDGSAGGIVSSANSLIGSTSGDKVGTMTLSPSGFSADQTGLIAVGNGNLVIASNNWDNGAAIDAGAVTWMNGSNGKLSNTLNGGAISTANSLIGSTSGDRLGTAVPSFAAWDFSGLTVLGNGNLVVSSNYWDNGAATDAGAVTWMNGSNGLLTDGLAGGAVSAANSVVGATANDKVGGGLYNYYNVYSNGRSVTQVSGNLVFVSPVWDNGGVADVGAVTWMNGATGRMSDGSIGAITSTNSLIGSTAGDTVGATTNFWALTDYYFTPQVFANGNIIFTSDGWNNGAVNDAGALTWMNGATGLLAGGATGGIVSATNSLIGSTANDIDSPTMQELMTGNLLIVNQAWASGVGNVNAGAVTWMNGSTGALSNGLFGGAIDATNSLIGSTAGDQVGVSVVELGNGNLAITSPWWDNWSTLVVDTGAVTWMNGTNGRLSDNATGGAITSGNSLIGVATTDMVGNSAIELLTDNQTFWNYAVRSTNWDNGAAVDAGAVTWVNGATGKTSDNSGLITTANSLVGSNTGDRIGFGLPLLLGNGNLVVSSYSWNNGAGAVTWMKGLDGTLADATNGGVVSATNSLVGSNQTLVIPPYTQGDQVGFGGLTEITDFSTYWNYVVLSPSWTNGAATGAGAVTLGNGATGTVGVVSASNSLVGSSTGDAVGSGGVALLWNGNFIVRSPNWSSGGTMGNGLGAMTWMNGSTGALSSGATGGVVGTANSLVGSNVGDQVGVAGGISGGVQMFGNNLLIRSQNWNGQFSAITWMDGTTGRLVGGANGGVVSASNSLLGSAALDDLGGAGVTVLPSGNWLIRSSRWGSNRGAITWMNGTNGRLADGTFGGVVSSTNSLVGTLVGDLVGGDPMCDCLTPGGIAVLSNGNFVVLSPFWNSNMGAATWGSGTAGVFGTVSASNSVLGVKNNVNEMQTQPGIVMIGLKSSNSGMGGLYLLGSFASGISGYLFADSPGVDGSIGAGWISATLNANTNVVLQANNDITQQAGAGITATGSGNLTLQAGRSVTLNDTISIAGALNIKANDAGANQAYRTVGSAVIDSLMATITAGVLNLDNAGGDILAGSMAATTGALTLKASNNILLAANRTLTTSGGAVSLISDVDGAGGGGIHLDSGSAIGSNGGSILLSGGTTPATTRAIGNGSVTGGITFNSGIYVLGNITAGAGNVTMRGGSALSDGITFAGGLLSSNGSVTIDGITSSALIANVAAVNFMNAGTRLTTVNGTVGIVGSSTNPSNLANANGIQIDTATIETTGSGSLTLTGDAVGLTSTYGIGLKNGGTVRTTATSGGGALTLTGNSVQDGGVIILNGHVLSNGGQILIEGANSNGLWDSIHIGLGSTIGGANAGNITLVSHGFLKNMNAGNPLSSAQRWLIYSADPANDTLGGITSDFHRYNCTYAGGCLTAGTTMPVTGNGMLYAIAPTLTIDAGAQSRMYGQSDSVLTYSITAGLINGDTAVSADLLAGMLGHTGTENVLDAHTITQGSLISPMGYGITSFTGGTLNITPAPLTVVADSKNKVLGTPDPLLTYMTYGLKFNDSAATTLSGQLNRDVGDTIGTYSINQGNLTLLSSNYTMTYVAGTFRILAPTVVQEITQTAVGASPLNEKKDTKESNDLLAEAATTDDSGQSLATPLPVCQ